MQVTALQGDTLDALCWRHLGSTSGGVVEQAFDMNRGAADHGPELVEGALITLPDSLPASATSRETVNLWD